MFKKADKQELRTWLIGDIFITLILAFVSVVCIVGLFTGTFSVGKLIWGIVFALLTVLFCSFFFKIINAIKTYEERKALKEKEESEKEAKEKNGTRASGAAGLQGPSHMLREHRNCRRTYCLLLVVI